MGGGVGEGVGLGVGVGDGVGDGVGVGEGMGGGVGVGVGVGLGGGICVGSPRVTAPAANGRPTNTAHRRNGGRRRLSFIVHLDPPRFQLVCHSPFIRRVGIRRVRSRSLCDRTPRETHSPRARPPPTRPSSPLEHHRTKTPSRGYGFGIRDAVDAHIARPPNDRHGFDATPLDSLVRDRPRVRAQLLRVLRLANADRAPSPGDFSRMRGGVRWGRAGSLLSASRCENGERHGRKLLRDRAGRRARASQGRRRD